MPPAAESDLLKRGPHGDEDLEEGEETDEYDVEVGGTGVFCYRLLRRFLGW
jgi:hypothetical protein